MRRVGGERASGGDDAATWKPSIEATARQQSGYPPNVGQRGQMAPQDRIRTNKLEGKPSPRRGLPPVRHPRPSDAAAGHNHDLAAAELHPDLSECLRLQYAAILSIAQAVNARPPPSDALLPGRPGEEATTTSLRAEVAHLRDTVSRQNAELARQQQEIAQLRAAMKTISEAQQAPVTQPAAVLAAPPPEPKPQPEFQTSPPAEAPAEAPEKPQAEAPAEPPAEAVEE